MTEDNKGIELRSEKVRNIVGKMPPVLLRIGISIITLILIMVVIGAYFMPYPEYVHLKVKIEYTEGTGYISAKIKDKIERGQSVELKTVLSRKTTTGYVSNIGSEPIYIDNASVYKITIVISDSSAFFRNSDIPYLEGEVAVLIADKSVLQRFGEAVGIKSMSPFRKPFTQLID